MGILSDEKELWTHLGRVILSISGLVQKCLIFSMYHFQHKFSFKISQGKCKAC